MGDTVNDRLVWYFSHGQLYIECSLISNEIKVLNFCCIFMSCSYFCLHRILLKYIWGWAEKFISAFDAFYLPMIFKSKTLTKEVCGLQEERSWKINLIWSRSMRIFWSVYELFSWCWYHNHFIKIFYLSSFFFLGITRYLC